MVIQRVWCLRNATGVRQPSCSRVHTVRDIWTKQASVGHCLEFIWEPVREIHHCCLAPAVCGVRMCVKKNTVPCALVFRIIHK